MSFMTVEFDVFFVKASSIDEPTTDQSLRQTRVLNPRLHRIKMFNLSLISEKDFHLQDLTICFYVHLPIDRPNGLSYKPYTVNQLTATRSKASMIFFTRKRNLFFLSVCATTLLLVSCNDSVAPDYREPLPGLIHAEKLTDLETVFKRYNYSIPNLNQGVPPLIVQSLPDDFAEGMTPGIKKTSFFKTLLPMVLLANDRIRQERQVLLQIVAQLETNQRIDDRQRHQLRTLKQRYKVQGELLNFETLKSLMRRVDEIPAALVLAQAANESAWGTSRFVREGNNLFGEWTFSPGSGIVPLERPEGEIYEVRRFNNLYDSILSYLQNLNTHPAYQSLRLLREEARQQGRKPSGIELAEGLVNYSTRREFYVSDLQKIIRTNNLQRFSAASLRQG